MNPLASYLKKSGISQEEFADMLSRSRGWKAYQSSVSRWVNGERKPSIAVRHAIERATLGEIPASAWDDWSAAPGEVA